MYPSPGQSFLIILQPGHAGFGIDFRRRRLCDFSIAIVSMEFIWWAPFKDRIGSAGTFALAMRGSETVAARACPACRAEAFREQTQINTQPLTLNFCRAERRKRTRLCESTGSNENLCRG